METVATDIQGTINGEPVARKRFFRTVFFWCLGVGFMLYYLDNNGLGNKMGHHQPSDVGPTAWEKIANRSPFGNLFHLSFVKNKRERLRDAH